MDSTVPRWKGKGFADIALANPMSNIVTQLQTSLSQSKAHAMLSGCNALLEAGQESADLINRTCFGRPITTSNKDEHWFQLGPEEAFYLCHALRCLSVSVENDIPLTDLELWEHMKSHMRAFPEMYRSYAHLRSKNWVVRSGTQYGVDFVAYQHHPALVHSQYAVLVLSGSGGSASDARLKVWSDLQSSLRVCGSVAKMLLILSVSSCCGGGGGGGTILPSCLEEFTVKEHAITRWIPEQCREDHGLEVNGAEQGAL